MECGGWSKLVSGVGCVVEDGGWSGVVGGVGVWWRVEWWEVTMMAAVVGRGGGW